MTQKQHKSLVAELRAEIKEIKKARSHSAEDPVRLCDADTPNGRALSASSL